MLRKRLRGYNYKNSRGNGSGDISAEGGV